MKAILILLITTALFAQNDDKNNKQKVLFYDSSDDSTQIIYYGDYNRLTAYPFLDDSVYYTATSYPTPETFLTFVNIEMFGDRYIDLLNKYNIHFGKEMNDQLNKILRRKGMHLIQN